MTQPVLDIQQLHLSFPGFNGDVHALNNVSLQINRGEIVGLVGESGSGKSVTAMLIMRLLQTGSYCVHRGQISLLGDDVLNAREKQLRQWRGARVAMIFQEPMTALNPTLRIGLQMMDVIRHHQPISRREARAKAIALLEEMQIPDAVEVMSRYPFELSGGMRQRVMIALAFSGGQRQRIAIARALSSQPDVIVLDEPTSALDISVQAQILNLLVTLQENHGLTYVLISHNVSVIRHMSDRVAVMYLGQIVELGEAQQVLTAPAHPYTRLLLDSLPAIDKPLEEEWALRKTDLPGNRTLPQGCFFYERCPLATHGCEVRQSLTIREDGREIRCWRAL
ncbi:ABC transporter ATP-binding protein [Escherichia coli]|nr:ABC transporter ATP-binding protein [Escherichia coli]PDU25200.1 peptide ABC transporter ATP-binding protein [Escherichia coli]HBP9920768.1 ABC transporter ATP-binding protein [Escherichia coli]